MPYKHKAVDINQAVNWMTTPHVNLKLIPNVRGDAEIAQLVSNISQKKEGLSYKISIWLGGFGALEDPRPQCLGR